MDRRCFEGKEPETRKGEDHTPSLQEGSPRRGRELFQRRECALFITTRGKGDLLKKKKEDSSRGEREMNLRLGGKKLVSTLLIAQGEKGDGS